MIINTRIHFPYFLTECGGRMHIASYARSMGYWLQQKHWILWIHDEGNIYKTAVASTRGIVGSCGLESVWQLFWLAKQNMKWLSIDFICRVDLVQQDI